MLQTNRILLPIKKCVLKFKNRFWFSHTFQLARQIEDAPDCSRRRAMVLITVGSESLLFVCRVLELFSSKRCAMSWYMVTLSSWLFFVTLLKTGGSKSDEENNLEFYPFSPRISQERSGFEIKTRSITRRLFYSARLDLLKKTGVHVRPRGAHG